MVLRMFSSKASSSDWVTTAGRNGRAEAEGKGTTVSQIQQNKHIRVKEKARDQSNRRPLTLSYSIYITRSPRHYQG